MEKRFTAKSLAFFWRGPLNRGGLLIACLLLLIACSPRVPASPPVTLDVETPPEVCIDATTEVEMSYAEAVEAAEQSACTQEGDLAGTGSCNSTTGTWWLDLDIERPGCAPACVVDVNTGAAEINWRCTGLTTPEEDETESAPQTEETETPVVESETPQVDPTATLEPRADWARYTNENYGFTFRYPISWTIELLTDRPEAENRAEAVRLTRGNVRLLVEYKRPDTELGIGPEDLPEGEIVERGTVTLLGRALPKYVLQQEGQDLVIFTGEQYVDLELYVQMHAVSAEGEPVPIPDDVQGDFDAIVDTFVYTDAAADDPYPGWLTYTRAGTGEVSGFTFRYPADWSLSEVTSDEGRPVLVLQNNDLVLRVQTTGEGDTGSLGESQVTGDASEAGVASFLGVAVPRQVVVDDGKLKRVYVQYAGDGIGAYVELSGDEDLLSYGDIDLPESARNMMDQVLGSFRLDAD